MGPYAGPSMIYSPTEPKTMPPGRQESIRRLAAPARSSAAMALQSTANEGHISAGVDRFTPVGMRTASRADAHGGLNGCGRGQWLPRWSLCTGAARW